MLICRYKSGCRTTNATYFGRPWLGPQHMWTNSTLTKKSAQDSPNCIFTKSKIAAKPHDLHTAWHTCMWGTTRLLHHATLTMLQASITKLWAMLSCQKIQDGCQTAWPTYCLTHLHVGDHKSTSPCKFEHCAGNYYWVMDHVKLLGGVTQHTKKIKNAYNSLKMTQAKFHHVELTPPPHLNIHTHIHTCRLMVITLSVW